MAITLHVRKADLDELTRFYEQQFWPFLASLDARAEDAAEEDLEIVSLSVLWARHQTSMEAAEDDKDGP